MKHLAAILVAITFVSLALLVFGIESVEAIGPAIQNPLGEAITLKSVLIRLTNWLLGLVAVLTLLGVVIGGVRMVAAVGNENHLASAKKIVLWSLAGLAVSALALTIINVLVVDILGISYLIGTPPTAYAQDCGDLPADVCKSTLKGDLQALEGSTGLKIFDEQTIASNIVNTITSLAGIVALVIFIIGAFMVIISLGNDSRVELGKKMMLYAVIGLLLIGLAYVVLRFVGNLLGIA